MILHSSLASANPLHYSRELTALDNLDFGNLHLDIEDSSFIDNITFGMKTVQAVTGQTPHPLSFHFMAVWPQCRFNALVEIRPTRIFVHAETLDYSSEALAKTRHTDARAELVFNSAAPIDAWRYLASELDGAMVVTSEPGGQGQWFIPSMCEKI